MDAGVLDANRRLLPYLNQILCNNLLQGLSRRKVKIWIFDMKETTKIGVMAAISAYPDNSLRFNKAANNQGKRMKFTL